MTAFPRAGTCSRTAAIHPSLPLPIRTRRFFGVQFHPEVAHTPRGREILDNFIFRICRCEPTWTMEHFGETAVQKIRAEVGAGRVLCALSGGVDSAVAATLVHRAIKERLVCVSSITDSCARTKPNKCAAYSSNGLATVFTTSMPASNFLAH